MDPGKPLSMTRLCVDPDGQVKIDSENDLVVDCVSYGNLCSPGDTIRRKIENVIEFLWPKPVFLSTHETIYRQRFTILGWRSSR